MVPKKSQTSKTDRTAYKGHETSVIVPRLFVTIILKAIMYDPYFLLSAIRLSANGELYLFVLPGRKAAMENSTTMIGNIWLETACPIIAAVTSLGKYHRTICSITE